MYECGEKVKIISFLLFFCSQINQAKPECGRQSLAELLIRPVQRLPSVALLLNGNLVMYFIFFSLSVKVLKPR